MGYHQCGCSSRKKKHKRRKEHKIRTCECALGDEESNGGDKIYSVTAYEGAIKASPIPTAALGGGDAELSPVIASGGERGVRGEEA